MSSFVLQPNRTYGDDMQYAYAHISKQDENTHASNPAASENGNINFHAFIFVSFCTLNLFCLMPFCGRQHICNSKSEYKKIMWILAYLAELLDFRQSTGKEFFFVDRVGAGFFSQPDAVRR